jgi:hypothetical protein
MASTDLTQAEQDAMYAALFKQDDSPLYETWVESLKCFERAHDLMDAVAEAFSGDEHRKATARRRPPPHRVNLTLKGLDAAMIELRGLLALTRNAMAEFDLTWPARPTPELTADAPSDAVEIAEQALLSNLRYVAMRAEEMQRVATAFIEWPRGIVPTSLREKLEREVLELWISVAATDNILGKLNVAIAEWSDRKRSLAQQN